MSKRWQQGDLLGAFDTQFTAYVRNLLRGDLGSLLFHPPGCLRAADGAGVADGGAGRARRGARHTFGHVARADRCLAPRVAHLDTGILLWGLFTWAMPTFFFGIILLILSGGPCRWAAWSPRA